MCEMEPPLPHSAFGRAMDCFACVRMKRKRRNEELSLSLAAHEIEVAALVGLQDGLIEQMRVAAPRPLRCFGGRQRGSALVKFGGIDKKIDASPRDIKPDHVAVLHQRQRAADRGFQA